MKDVAESKPFLIMGEVLAHLQAVLIAQICTEWLQLLGTNRFSYMSYDNIFL